MYRSVKWLLLSVIFILSVALFAEDGLQGKQARTVNIFVISTGDIHQAPGQIDNIYSYVKNARNNHPGRVILVDAGDMLSKEATPARKWASTSPDGNKIFSWADKIKYDAMAIGNHDFIGNVKNLVDMMKKYNLPYVCSNLEHPDLGGNTIIPPYRVVTINATGKDVLNVGIIGISDETHKDFHHKDQSDKTKLVTHPEYNKYIVQKISELEKKSDFVIVLSHNKDKADNSLIFTKLKNDPKVVLLVGGHSHNLVSVSKQKSKGLIKSGKEGEYIGSSIITWDFNRKKVSNVSTMNVKMKKVKGEDSQSPDDGEAEPAE